MPVSCPSLMLCGLLLAAASVTTLAGDVTINDPWIPAAPPGASMMAGYLEIHNRRGTPLVITGAESPSFERIEIHRSTLVDGTARMRREKRLEIAPGQKMAFEPGGLHLMLMRPTRKLRPGLAVSIRLIDDAGRKLPFTAEVRAREP